MIAWRVWRELYSVGGDQYRIHLIYYMDPIQGNPHSLSKYSRSQPEGRLTATKKGREGFLWLKVKQKRVLYKDQPSFSCAQLFFHLMFNFFSRNNCFGYAAIHNP